MGQGRAGAGVTALTEAADASESCRWCGILHGKLCPYVKALEFSSNREVTRVEFLTPADFARPADTDKSAMTDYPKLGEGTR